MSKDKVFIIGNGFDLSLGWPTRYSDFVNSRLWRFNDGYSSLGIYLNNVAKSDEWFNLEESLKSYAYPGSKYHRQNEISEINFDKKEYDKDDFKRLKFLLTGYLKRVQEELSIDVNSPAAIVLKAICNNGGFKNNYFSFNYTDLDNIASKLGLKDLGVHYIHGNLKDNNIIIGFNDNVEVYQGYTYMYKDHNPACSPYLMEKALQQTDEAVFFGLSFDEIDFDYFKDFFDRISTGSVTDIKITIFTRDENSRESILNNIKHLSDHSDIYKLKNKSDFSIICTNSSDKSNDRLMECFLKRLKDESVANHTKNSN